ncbi:MAG TPA: glycine cleavage system aminomethyltransferase GcvT [Methylococcaceae bacterium]|nr:glycine cleavage system aminomethyltransferase GcvT [Methylococcaceae bacterium]
MAALKKTALYALHLELAAKMTDFAAYTLPLHYADGIIKEHLHCRQQLGFFDISHMGQISLSGASVAQALETLTPGNIQGLQPGQLRYAVLTRTNAGIIDDIMINRLDTGFMLTVNAACKAKVLTHLQAHLSSQCQLEILPDQALFAIQGPLAKQLMAQLSATASTLSFMHSCTTRIEHMPCIISRCGYTGEDGFEISIDNQYAEPLARKLLAFAAIKPIGLGARDSLRLEAGLGLYGHEYDESISPVEAGLSWTFRKNASHFPGAHIIHCQQQTGVSKRLAGLLIEEKAMIRADTPLYDDKGTPVGMVTSGGYSPCLKKTIALAFIDAAYPHSSLIAKVRHRTLTAQITALPFLPHRYHRGSV